MAVKMKQQTALYRFYDSNQVLLYVGISKNLMTRFQNHYESKPWINQVAETKVEWFDSRSIAGINERAAIRWEYPLYNKQSVVIGTKEEKHFALLESRIFDDFFHQELHFKIKELWDELPNHGLNKAKLEWCISNALFDLSTDDEELALPCADCLALGNSWWLNEGHALFCDLYARGEN